MNPQVSPWMIIADKQRYSDLKRQQQEKQLKNFIKINYQKELSDQINQQKQLKLKQKRREKEWEKNIINASIQNQQRIIEMEKLKQQASNEKQNRLDFQNQYYKAARKQRQDFIQQQTKRLENQMHKQAEERQKKQNAQAQWKKKMILENLKGSIEAKQMKQRYQKHSEQQLQNIKLKQNQMLSKREENYREDYLKKLKQRAMTIDYGSHDAFNRNAQKSLVQRKKQQWQNEQEYLRRSKQLDIYEEDYKRLKMGMQKDYGSQLQRQISQRQQKKRFNQRRELQNDQENMMRYQLYSKSVDMQKKANQQKGKKQLLDYLQKQVDYKRSLPKQPYYMRDKQIQLNIDLLQKSKGIIPGETYDLDPARKRQLETVAKSIAYSPSIVEKNFLAERGKTIIS